MKTVLISAFGPYDCWEENASWLALIELIQNLPGGSTVTTRRYPVDFGEVKKLLANDLADNYDMVLHLGQAPGTSRVQLESIGINVGGKLGQMPEDYRPLSEDGPVAYRSDLPLDDWAREIRSTGIPAQVSHHAGTYLCNATLYWTHYLAERMDLSTRAAFIHLPLDTSQVVGEMRDLPSLPATVSANALRIILQQAAEL